MKENRRVKYTKMFLNESLLKFLAQKPITKITVREICEDADVNRSTYYAHFTDIYDQLKQLEAELLNGMIANVDDIVKEGVYDTKNKHTIIKNILEYFYKNRETFKVLLQNNATLDLQKDILSFFGERIFDKETQMSRLNQEMYYAYIYASRGFFGVVSDWIFSDCKTDIDELTKIMIEFISKRE